MTDPKASKEEKRRRKASAGRRGRDQQGGYEAPAVDWGKPLTPREAREALGLSEVEKIANLLGGQTVLRRRVVTTLDAHDLICDGFPAPSVERLIKTLLIIGVQPSLEKALGVSWRTVQRQKNTPKKRLSQEQSGRMWRFAEILAKATEVFGSQHDAEQWMERPATGLEQRRPIDLLETPAGAELVETFLERIDYGVYT